MQHKTSMYLVNLSLPGKVALSDNQVSILFRKQTTTQSFINATGIPGSSPKGSNTQTEMVPVKSANIITKIIITKTVRKGKTISNFPQTVEIPLCHPAFPEVIKTIQKKLRVRSFCKQISNPQQALYYYSEVPTLFFNKSYCFRYLDKYLLLYILYLLFFFKCFNQYFQNLFV